MCFFLSKIKSNTIPFKCAIYFIYRKLRQGSLLSNIQSICATLIALLNVATDIQVASKCRSVGSHHRRESHYDIAVGMDCRTITTLSGVVVQAVKHLSYSDADLPPITGFIK